MKPKHILTIPLVTSPGHIGSEVTRSCFRDEHTTYRTLLNHAYTDEKYLDIQMFERFSSSLFCETSHLSKCFE